jgi:hypothetical protein
MKYDSSKEIDVKRSDAYYAKLKEQKAKFELKKIYEKRSLNQNAYLHVAFAILGDDTGYTVEEVKVVAKREFGRFLVYEKNGERFYRSTSDLNTLEFYEFTDWFRTFSLDQGIYIPTPEEYYENQWLLENQYRHML